MKSLICSILSSLMCLFALTSCIGDEDEPLDVVMSIDLALNKPFYYPGDTVVCSFAITGVQCEKKVEVHSISSYLGYKKIDFCETDQLDFSYILPLDILSGEHELLLRVLWKPEGYEEQTTRFRTKIIVN